MTAVQTTSTSPAVQMSPSETSSGNTSELGTSHLNSRDHRLTAPLSPATSVETPGLLKRKRRAFLACERCRARKIRCNVDNGIPCHNCITDDCDCMPARPKKLKGKDIRRNEKCMSFLPIADAPWSIHSGHGPTFQRNTTAASVTRDTTMRKLALQQKRRGAVEAAEQHCSSIVSERLALWLLACPLNLRYELYSHLNLHGHWSKRFKNPPDPEYLEATLAYSIECVHEEMSRLCEKMKTETTVDVKGLASCKTGSSDSPVDFEHTLPQNTNAVVRESITTSNSAALGSAAKLQSGAHSHDDNVPHDRNHEKTRDSDCQLDSTSVFGHILIPAETDENLNQGEAQQQYSDEVNNDWGVDDNPLQEGFIDLEDFLV